jgi:hypothetical protein
VTSTLQGADTGTDSKNLIHVNAGDDVIVLNAETGVTARALDTIFLEGPSIGDDTIFNFTSGEDTINVRAFMNSNVAALGTVVTAANFAFVGTVQGPTGVNGAYTAGDFDTIAGGTGTAANSKGLVFSQAAANSNTYTVFYVQNNNDTAIDFATEVTIIGTVTDAHAAGTIANGDFVI